MRSFFMSKKTELIVALDFGSLDEALKLVKAAGPAVEWYKVGSQLFTVAGPEAVKALKKEGKKVFLDLKFHDIPNTVANAVAAAVRLGVDMVNVHASGGRAMMEAAVKAAAEEAAKAGGRPLVIAVTVLTSMDEKALCEAINRQGHYTPAEHVPHLAKLAKSSGMHGVVASAHEIEIIRDACGKDFKLVIPGIRPSGPATDDQKRTMTAAEAAAKGADFIVVGRPVLKAPDPAKAAREIVGELVNGD
jgi:orotidine-5'-phosphate decarboxylase